MALYIKVTGPTEGLQIKWPD